MKHFPEAVLALPHLKPECEIISRVITSALNAGYHIAVHDGEEWSVRPTRDRAEIEAACFATDYTAFRLRDKNAGDVNIGFIEFVHGNGVDVIHDYSKKPAIEKIVKPAQDFANKYYTGDRHG